MEQRTFLDRVKNINADIIETMSEEELRQELGELPDFTVENTAELKELKAKYFESKSEEEREKLKRRIDKLQFYKAADTHRDFAEDEDFKEFDLKHLIIAMKDFVIAKSL